jgi:hypothetical protein
VAHVSDKPLEAETRGTHGLGDALDVVAKNLTVTLSAALAETLRASSVGASNECSIGSGEPFRPFRVQTW